MLTSVSHRRINRLQDLAGSRRFVARSKGSIDAAQTRQLNAAVER
jgi:hypothetical protein